ncbi:uncharacterized protein LOC133778891 [Humulus lupulus]|uniref:uncharacterized protein LOC133778891 n=1 Tax=Humulus lupulus TaxID=3486 RepID=UPI002B411220|nr:uncharacterized protein LOC133778891 [Humulus lupulus]
MPSYVKFMKDILSKKRRMDDYETIALTEECSSILQRKLPQKLGLGEARPTIVTLQLEDRSVKHPRCIIEDVLVKVDTFIFRAYFIVHDMEEDEDVPIILGRPFLATGQALLYLQKGELKLGVQGEEVVLNVFKALNYPQESYSYCSVNVLDEDCSKGKPTEDPLELSLISSLEECDGTMAIEYVKWLNTAGKIYKKKYEELGQGSELPLPSIEKPPTLEMKSLPEHFCYAYLGEKETLPVIISASLSTMEEEKLLRV